MIAADHADTEAEDLQDLRIPSAYWTVYHFVNFGGIDYAMTHVAFTGTVHSDRIVPFKPSAMQLVSCAICLATQQGISRKGTHF